MQTKWLAAIVLCVAVAALYVPVIAQDKPPAPKEEPPKEQPKEPPKEEPKPGPEKKEEPAIDDSKFTEAQKANVKVLDAVMETIRTRFYDKKYGGHDLKEMRNRYVQRVADSQQKEPLYALLRQMLAEFKVSHLTMLTQDVYDTNFAPEMQNGRSTRPGLDISELEPGNFFVSALLDGGGAQKAGVLRGDRVVEIEGKPAAESPLLVDSGGDPGIPGHPHYFIRVPAEGETLTIKVQRKADDKQLLTLKIECTATSMIEATRKSVTIIEHEGRKFGYIHFWHFLHGGMTDSLRRGLTKTWKECDGLIVDLRGRGGSVQVMNDCFSPFGDPPRGGRNPNVQRNALPKWGRPVVALQDSGSRSAKEIYAHNWKWVKAGPLVGEPSCGAVLASNFVQMPDGSYLLLPAQDARMYAYGQTQLEGNPVAPTVEVRDLLAYAAGGDAIKDAGIKALFELVKDKPKIEPAPDPDFPRKEEEFSIGPGVWRKAG